ncbi:MAG: hypothetical protein J2P54_06075 [Bradyrhizobiaceae bacterium]|nr:hypothetical protein [Bradyrhizobiaceae bacterium]
MPLRSAVLMPMIALAAAVTAREVETPNSSDAPIHVATGSVRDARRSPCTSDAVRLCGPFIPDINGIIACLKVQRPNLSPACGAVLP